MKFLAALFIFILVSCTPQRRFTRLITKHPELLQTDTIIRHDTIRVTVPKIEHDTAFLESFLHDTVVIEKERLKIEGISDPDRRAMITVAPGYPITILDISYPRIIFIIRFYHLGIARHHFNGTMVYFPINTIFTEAGENIHLYCLVVTTEDTGKAIFERYHGAIENTV